MSCDGFPCVFAVKVYYFCFVISSTREVFSCVVVVLLVYVRHNGVKSLQVCAAHLERDGNIAVELLLAVMGRWNVHIMMVAMYNGTICLQRCNPWQCGGVESWVMVALKCNGR